MKRILSLIFITIWLVAGALVYFEFKSMGSEVAFRTTQVQVGPIAEILKETGTVQFSRTVIVKSTISGKIQRVDVEVGDRVASGTVLAVLEPDPAQSLQLSQQRARVDGARIDLTKQELIFGRKSVLHGQTLISSEEYDMARIDNLKAKHNLRVAELELRTLELKVGIDADSSMSRDAIKILSPLTGIVISRLVESGEIVASGTASFTGGTEMFQIGDMDRMIVRAAVSEIDIGRVNVGQEVRIKTEAYPELNLLGRVIRVAPVGVQSLGSTLVTFDAEIELISPSQFLHQGMSCDVDIVLREHDQALQVPLSSVLETSDQSVLNNASNHSKIDELQDSRYIVYRCVITGSDSSMCSMGSLEAIPVELGIEASSSVQVMSGIDLDAHIAVNAREVHALLESLQE